MRCTSIVKPSGETRGLRALETGQTVSYPLGYLPDFLLTNFPVQVLAFLVPSLLEEQGEVLGVFGRAYVCPYES